MKDSLLIWLYIRNLIFSSDREIVSAFFSYYYLLSQFNGTKSDSDKKRKKVLHPEPEWCPLSTPLSGNDFSTLLRPGHCPYQIHSQRSGVTIENQNAEDILEPSFDIYALIKHHKQFVTQTYRTPKVSPSKPDNVSQDSDFLDNLKKSNWKKSQTRKSQNTDSKSEYQDTNIGSSFSSSTDTNFFQLDSLEMSLEDEVDQFLNQKSDDEKLLSNSIGLSDSSIKSEKWKNKLPFGLRFCLFVDSCYYMLIYIYIPLSFEYLLFYSYFIPMIVPSNNSKCACKSGCEVTDSSFRYSNAIITDMIEYLTEFDLDLSKAPSDMTRKIWEVTPVQYEATQVPTKCFFKFIDNEMDDLIFCFFADFGSDQKVQLPTCLSQHYVLIFLSHVLELSHFVPNTSVIFRDMLLLNTLGGDFDSSLNSSLNISLNNSSRFKIPQYGPYYFQNNTPIISTFNSHSSIPKVKSSTTSSQPIIPQDAISITSSTHTSLSHPLHQIAIQAEYMYQRGFPKVVYSLLRDNNVICPLDLSLAVRQCHSYKIELDMTQFLRILQRAKVFERILRVKIPDDTSLTKTNLGLEMSSRTGSVSSSSNASIESNPLIFPKTVKHIPSADDSRSKDRAQVNEEMLRIPGVIFSSVSQKEGRKDLIRLHEQFRKAVMETFEIAGAMTIGSAPEQVKLYWPQLHSCFRHQIFCT
jgi:hypothetical protein